MSLDTFFNAMGYIFLGICIILVVKFFVKKVIEKNKEEEKKI